MEPLDTTIISPQVGTRYISFRRRYNGPRYSCREELFQQFDPNFSMYQFMVRSDETNRYNPFLHQ